MNYRREIDGLRALAVLPVILYHAGFNAFSGGFVGVDVFFVISGYLITSIILAEKQAGTFSLMHFYERRARRILPALFLVMAVCIPFAWLWLLPNDMKSFSQSIVAVAAFVSNIFFLSESGYFDTAAELKPLLHTWSLAVEEQFYLLFPLFLLFTRRLKKNWTLGLLIITAIVSLSVAHWGAFNRPAATFFLLPTRSWELLIGVLIAYYLGKEDRVSLSETVSQLASITGLLLFLYAVLAFDKSTPFPSLYALVPTIGVSLIILSASPTTFVGRVLGSKWFVGVGLISYSAYLWHQPLFAFARHRRLTEPNAFILILLALAAIVLAYFSWRFVEQPFRNKRITSRNVVFGSALCCTAFAVAAGVGGHFTNGFEDRFNMPEHIVKSFNRTPRTEECFDKIGVHKISDWLCKVGDSSKPTSFFVFGDSHALALLEMFSAAALKEKLGGAFTGASGCAPLLGIYALRPDQMDRDCNALNKRVIDYVKKEHIKKIFLVARWTYYTDGGYEGTNFSYIGLDPNDRKSKDTSREAFEYGVALTVKEYAAIGVEVFFVNQVPQQLYDPKIIYYRSYENNVLDTAALERLSVKLNQHMRLQQFVANALNKYEGLKIVSYDQRFCASGKCLVGDGDGSFYMDDDHLSTYGAARLVENTRQLLRY